MLELFEALGIVEAESIALGYVLTDAMVKKSPVRIRRAQTVHPGKYLVIVDGGVAEVDEAMQAALSACGAGLIDSVFLPHAHAQVPRALERGLHIAVEGSLAVLETSTVSAAVRGADAAVKMADVRLVDMVLADDLGGKAYFVLTGRLEEIQSAVQAAAPAITKEKLLREEIIANPHAESVHHWESLLKKLQPR